MGDFDPLWEEVANILPGLEHVRIHLDPDRGFDMEYFDFKQFAGLARLPNIVTVQFELRCEGEPCAYMDYDEKEVGSFGEKLVKTIEVQAERLGKRLGIKVT